jgi:hypothetical protein
MTPNSIEFIDTGRWVMRITADRRIEVNEGVDVSEAAQKVLDAMQGLLTPQRTWVGLTDEEVYEIYGSVQEEVNEHWERGGTTMMFPTTLYKAIEAKLKERNT